MSNDLIYVKDGRLVNEGTEGARALMLFRDRGHDALPWHKFAYGSKEPFTVEQVCQLLLADEPVTVESLYTATGSRFRACAGTYWLGRELGAVGPNYNPHQNREFLETSLIPWVEAGYEIESAGYLRGGSVIWCQVNVEGLMEASDLTVRDGDAVRPYGFFVHSHDESLGLVGGPCLERSIGSSMLRLDLNDGGFFRKKHYGTKNKDKQFQIADALFKIRQSTLDDVEKFRFLDNVAVRGTKDVYAFVDRIASKRSNVEPGDFKPTKVHAEVAHLFEHGRGNRGESYWDLLSAWAERSAHSEGNSKEGESEGQRSSRRLDAQWFGAVGNSNSRALAVALEMAKKAA